MKEIQESDHTNIIYQYLRDDAKWPHVWCSGCGNGMITSSLLRAIHQMGWKKDEVVIVSGIGCSSRLPTYVDFNTLHTTHGRAIAFATGVKLGNPDLNLIVVTGDGDGLAIGGNHFIHACRRNVNLTVILVNNYIYGMTGGQYSPTTPKGKFATTAPYGNLEPPFDPSELAKAAGATFVGRTTVYHAVQMDKLILQALQKKGFSFVEILADCPTLYGRLNRQGTPVDMINIFKEMAIPIAQASKLAPEKLQGRITTGVLWNIVRPEFCEEYDKIIQIAREKKAKMDKVEEEYLSKKRTEEVEEL
ncbi:MAG: 2-oxoacid:ferredoxin oxidoreductase subunit beta [Acidobacteriota bacterium]